MRYDRRCNKCGYVEETNEPMAAVEPQACPDCEAEGAFVRAILGNEAPPVHFKGLGWPDKDHRLRFGRGRNHKA